MKLSLSLLLAVHGAIHLLGFVKAFRLAEVAALKQPISRPLGALWLVATLLFLAAAVLVHAAPGRWWWAAAPGLVLSQLLVATAWSDARFGTVANAILLVPVAVATLAAAPWGLRAGFDRAVATHPPAPPAAAGDRVTEADLARLPPAVQRYLRRAGVVGRPRVRGFTARFTGRIRNGVGTPWMPFTADQRTTFDPPDRLFLIEASRGGVPFQALHELAGPHATMRVRVASLVDVVDARGPVMDRSETVTFLNDMVLLAPGALVDAEVRWEVLDPQSVRATYTRGAETISAVLVFDAQGDLADFVSEDRSMSADGKSFARVPWSTPVRSWRERDGARVLERGDALWRLPEGEFVYGEFTLERLELEPR